MALLSRYPTTHNKVIYEWKWAILNFNKMTFFRAHQSLEPHILSFSNGLAILHGFPDIMHNKVNIGRKFLILQI